MKIMNRWGVIVAAAVMLGACAAEVQAERLVILTTNDTHSQIDPDFDGKGGVLRRKVLIDSIRGAEKNVLLLDAGDAVQGTLYFSLFNGEVEAAMLDSLGYDIRTLGNHEFDNGMEMYARYFKNSKSTCLSSYGLKGTVLDGMCKPYVIREYAGRRIGIMGVNLLPKGMISDANCKGVVYTNSIEAANATAHKLKTEENVDYVVMLSHVAYSGGTSDNPSDLSIVKAGKDIDLVVGGHSHTTIDPAATKPKEWKVKNADGREVIVTQGGSLGKNVGYIAIDLDDLNLEEYKLMPVDKRYDSRADYPALKQYLAPFKHKVDSIMSNVVVCSKKDLDRSKPLTWNLIADAAYELTANQSGLKIDAAIVNSGGIRRSLPKGKVTEGEIRSMLPFDNKIVVLRMTGQELIDALKVMARRGGDPVSRQLKVIYTMDAAKTVTLKKATIAGKTIDPQGTYLIATIDYLANGGDYMVSMRGCERLYNDSEKFGDRFLEYAKMVNAKGKKFNPSNERRMKKCGK